MSDHATPNLPSRDFKQTAQFYRALGFEQGWRDAGWMILRRGTITLEFFSYPDLDPKTSSFSCCLRLDDVDAFHALCTAAGIAEQSTGAPRIQAPRREPSGLRIGYLIDPDGTLVRLVQNPD